MRRWPPRMVGAALREILSRWFARVIRARARRPRLPPDASRSGDYRESTHRRAVVQGGGDVAGEPLPTAPKLHLVEHGGVPWFALVDRGRDASEALRSSWTAGRPFDRGKETDRARSPDSSVRPPSRRRSPPGTSPWRRPAPRRDAYRQRCPDGRHRVGGDHRVPYTTRCGRPGGHHGRATAHPHWPRARPRWCSGVWTGYMRSSAGSREEATRWTPMTTAASRARERRSGTTRPRLDTSSGSRRGKACSGAARARGELAAIQVPAPASTRQRRRRPAGRSRELGRCVDRSGVPNPGSSRRASTGSWRRPSACKQRWGESPALSEPRLEHFLAKVSESDADFRTILDEARLDRFIRSGRGMWQIRRGPG